MKRPGSANSRSSHRWDRYIPSYHSVLFPTGPQRPPARPALCAFWSTPKGTARSKDLSEAKLKLLDVQTRLREVELAEKEGTLISKAAVEQEWFRIAREIRDNLTNIASRIAGLVAVEKNQEACYQIVDKEMRQALERLAS